MSRTIPWLGGNCCGRTLMIDGPGSTGTIGSPATGRISAIATAAHELIPSHSSSVDIDAYMREMGRRARAASPALARAGTREKNQALEATAQAILDGGEALQAANRDLQAGRGSRTGARARHRFRPAGPPRAHSRTGGGDGRGLERGRGAAGPGRRNQRAALPSFRNPGRPHAGTARRHRHRLRVTTQRHRRRGGPVPQGGQRHPSPGGIGSHPLQPRHRELHRRGPRSGRASAGRGTGGRDHGPGRGRSIWFAWTSMSTSSCRGGARA